MYLEARSPRELVGVSKLSPQEQTLCNGKDVKILQVEYDLFEDHGSLENEILSFVKGVDAAKKRAFRLIKAVQKDGLFEFVRRTVHATAVASIIKDRKFGIVPSSEFYFDPSAGIKTTSGFVDLKKSAIAFGLKRGDIISISLQTRIDSLDGPKHIPIDFNLQVRSAINDLARSKGIITFIAAGNSAQNLDTIQEEDFGQDFFKYSDCHQVSEALLVGYCSEDYSQTLYSNYGELVEFHAPAQSVLAACYNSNEHGVGDLLEATSGGFCRTSAATPMIASIAAAVQSAYKELTNGNVLSKNDLIQILRNSAIPCPADRNPIGVFPDISNAILAVKQKVQAQQKHAAKE